MKTMLLFAVLTFTGFDGNAQVIKSFTPDSIKYLEEVSKMFLDADKKRYKPFVEEFTLIWYSGEFTDEQRLDVYKTSNAMLKKRMRTPEFEPYLFSLMSFIKSDIDDQSFKSWQESLDKLIAGRKKSRFTDYLKMSANLFSDNIMFKSASTTWKSSNNNYQFVYDSVPKIVFPELNLICYSKRDSSVIYDTKGVYYPNTNRFIGESGKVTWERVGLDVNETYAVFESYNLRIKSAGFTIDSVMFFNSFFKQPLKGRLTEKILAKTGENAGYPRFESYDKRLTIPNIVDGVDYDGGFTMHGAKLLGAGSKQEPARLIFYRNQEPFLITKSLFYTIKPDKIASSAVGATFYLEEDSISHPGLVMKFMKEERTLTLVRDNEVNKSPYFNSFHNLDMYFEALYWNIDDPLIEMGALFGSTDRQAQFESVNYYQQARYDRLQGIDQVHPLIRLKDISKRLDSDEFTAMDVAKEMRLSIEQVKPLLMMLSADGFISYDNETEIVFVKEKAKDYIWARAGKIDYDVITFNSEVSNESNAVLNLLNYDLLIRGVKKVNLSDSQRCMVFPADRQINMKRNRDFQFLGAFVAGRTTYYGKEFFFSYDKFNMDLINVDSMQLRALAFDEAMLDDDGNRRWVKVRSVLEGIRGTIAIDNPFNKSGIQNEEYPEYPILTVTKKSYVFYDNSRIHDGVYNRDKFYFQVDPFVMDSLDNYPNESVAFDGTFVSAGIFPEFREQLKIQEDYSLGFIRNTPTDGFSTYGSNVRYDNEIRLSHDGLKGDGEIDFLNSLSKSRDFTFFPDSVRGAGSFVNEEDDGDPEFPDVKSDSVMIKYVPKKKALVAKKIREDIDFFSGEAKLDGLLVLKPNGMVGRGKMDFETADLTSQLFRYGRRTIDADTSAFNLNTSTGGVAIESTNVNAHIDFDERKGEFKANGEADPTIFPENDYICYMDKFDWFMDAEKLEFSASKGNRDDLVINTDLDLSGSNFFSIHPDQDSLNFMSPKAVYDVTNFEINCQEVEYIKVADAKIIPDSGSVKIMKKAKMETLENSSVEANFVTKYHVIHSASINIYSAKSYAGSGDYEYVDENKEGQTIHFTQVTVDTTYQTTATGTIAEEDEFSLSPNFGYKGKVDLRAADKHLLFNGSTRIYHDCPNIAKSWMAFETSINPEEIYIPVGAELKNEEGKAIGAGVILNPDSISIYSTFLSVKKKAEHPDVLAAEGFLFFDKKAQEYQISNKDKLKERSLPGNFTSLNINSCEVTGDGAINFGTKLGLIDVKPIGKVKHDMAKDEVEIQTSMALNFPFNDQAMEKIPEFINQYPDLEVIDFEKTTYEQSLRELVGLQRADKLYGELALNGQIKKLPDELKTTLYLADVKFKWNKNNRAYESVGKIGIGNIHKKQVFKYVAGKIQIKKQRASKGDVLTIYLEVDANNWYFFTYTRGLMQGISSDKEFNNIIKETKEDKRKFKGTKEQGNYMFMLSTTRKKVDFLKKFDSL